MANILRHTGINIGGLNPVSWIFREDVAMYSFNDSTLYCLINPKPGKSWSSIYGTPETIQLESELVQAHVEAKTAWDLGANEKDMESILQKIRNGQWYWDYVTASHGAAFHSPVEVTRIIGNGMHETQEARVLLARLLAKLGKNMEVPYPDIATKEKAQKYIGLDMSQLRKDKEEFLRNIVPGWDKAAKEREDRWKIIMN